MKKIFVFLLLMVVSFAVKAQYPITQNLGADSTLIYVKGAVRTVGGFINGTYTDTAAANLTRIRQYQAAQIFTTGDSAMWFRSVGATKWIRMNAGGGGSPTTDTFYWRTGGNYITDTAGYRGILGTINNKPLIFMTNNQKRLVLTENGLQNLGTTNKGFMMYDTTTGVWSYATGGSGVYTAGNGLTLSGSQFKLGGTLSENTHLFGANKRLTADSLNYFDFVSRPNTYASLARIRANGSFDEGTSGVLLSSSNEDNTDSSYLKVSGIVELRSWGQDIRLKNIPTVSSTTGRKVALIDTVTGKVERIDPASLVSTPTLQQVLTAGSTLTQNNTIDVDGNEFAINNALSFLINTVSGTESSNIDVGSNISMNSIGSSPNYESKIIIRKDSLSINPYQGIINIDSLRTWSGVSDTTYKKPMTWDTRNGRWEYAANWYGGGGGSGVTTVGTFSGSSQTNGASISGSTITFGPADATNPGMVSTGTQTFAGDKTYTGRILLPNGSAASPALSFTNATSTGLYWTPSSMRVVSGGLEAFLVYTNGTVLLNDFRNSSFGTIFSAAGVPGAGFSPNFSSTSTNLLLRTGTASANTAPLKFTTGTSLTTAEAGAMEYTTPQLFFTNGRAIRQEIPQIQQSRVSADVSVTSNTTLANVTGLTANVAASGTYRFEARLYTTSANTGGVKFAIGGTATATDIIYEGVTTDAGVITQTRAGALATTVGAVTNVTTAYTVITGTITVNAAGTLTVQFAQNASDGTASVVKRGSTFVLTEIN